MNLLGEEEEQKDITADDLSGVAKGLLDQREFIKSKAPHFPELGYERADRATVPSTAYEKSNSFLNMIIGPELALFGVKWDGHGWDASLDNVRRQWAEEPLWSNLLPAIGLVSMVALPAATSFGAAYKYGSAGAKAMGRGKGGVRFGRTATTHGFQVRDAAGLFGERGANIRWFDQFMDEADERAFLLRIGALDPNAVGAPTELRNARIVAHRKLQAVDTYLREGQHEIFNAEFQSAFKKIKNENPDLDDVKAGEMVMGTLKGRGIVDAEFSPLERAKMEFNKRFANRFFEYNNDVTPYGQLKTYFNESLSKRFDPTAIKRWAELERVIGDSTDFQKKFYQVAIERAAPSLGEKVVFSKRYSITPEENSVIQKIIEYAEANQKRAIDSGMWSVEQGNLHINSLRVGGLKNQIHTLESGSNFRDRTFTPSLMERKSSLQQVWDLVEGGRIQADSVRKIINSYIMDDLLHFNYETMRDLIIHDKFVFNPLRDPGLGVKPNADLPPPGYKPPLPKPGLVEYQIHKYDDALNYYGGPEYIPKTLVSLDDMFRKADNEAGRRRLIAMVEKKAPNMIATMPNGDKRLPFVPKFISDALMDMDEGLRAVTQANIHFWDVMTMMHKGAKAPLNPATHTQNILGNIVFMSMAGMNPFAPENMRLMKQSTSAFKAIHDAHDLAVKELGKRASSISIRRKIKENLLLSDMFIDYARKDGTVFRTHVSELGETIVQQLYEEGAFDAIEGAAGIVYQAERHGTKAAKTTAKYFDKFQTWIKKGGLNESVSLGGLFDGMSKWYLGEDVIPKIALYLKNRAGGLSVHAAVSEVSRRMPMYGSVGSWIQEGRRVLFPWASFPTEALRIIKNNMLDNPLRVLPWLYFTRVAQGMFSTMGIAESTLEGVQEAKEQLPVWAQTPSTVMTTGDGGILPHLAPGVMQGGLAGGLVGAAFGGPMGALAGAALGGGAATTPAILNHFLEKDKDGAMLRGAVLNWLPHTSFMLQSTSPQYSPFAEGIDGMTSMRRMLDLSPAEPLAILKPMMDILLGVGPFGEPIQSGGAIDFGSKVFAGLIGFVSPPWVQKYGFKTTTPDVALSDWALGKNNPDLVRDLDPSNVSRLLVDMGVAADTVTGMPGNPMTDIFLSNIGILKTHPAVADRYYANLELNNISLEKVRNFHSRNLRFYIENGDEGNSADILRRVFMTFQQEYIDNPGTAVDKFADWLKKRWSAVGKSPQLAGMSKEELEFRFDEAMKFAKEALTTARQTRVDALLHERNVRKWMDMQRRYLGKNYATGEGFEGLF